ncbi:hypothetical protein PQJ75_19600 [Rhodoplanes sp. TEM]|uniref:Uncharacterized protein n=1 Tax=Rhodoplanes tepidamans TaxID=200616 RepID=A0ABT5JDB9_RHOTP|nr:MULTISPECIES: hypothetical protein [Rhodoplanes]MDC7787674.1 hypothetical protein [Rhodoplanes tepidamans]MDC7985942.1 hypothetical protein [Rhodoplanes sp. TEM]MDQ0355247.1 hypothetical protein [Rhodoplanes tepidamans]
MRPLFTIAFVVSLLAGPSAAQAEKRIFILANNPDAYGIDHCLATGARCGNAMATALCRQHDFKQAVSFRKVDRDEITGSVPVTSGCRGAACEDFVAIECAR